MTYPNTATTTHGAAPFPVPELDDSIEIKDFTLKTKYHKFRVDDDVFVAHGALGLPAMQDLVKLSKTLGEAMRDGSYDNITELFKQLLAPASAERFSQRVQARGEDAIDVRQQLVPIIYWLLEKYGLRPTQQSSVSSTGSPSGTDGTTSTAGSSSTVTG